MSDVLAYLGAAYAWLLTPAGLVLSGVLVVAIWADVAVRTVRERRAQSRHDATVALDLAVARYWDVRSAKRLAQHEPRQPARAPAA